MVAGSVDFDSGSAVNPLLCAQGTKNAYTHAPNEPFAKTNWKGKKTDSFHWVYSDEPHKTRRKEILKQHPQIKELYGPEPLTAYIVVALTIAQLWVASWIENTSWPLYCLLVYAFGGTVNHTLQLANHEISHNLAFEDTTSNVLLGIFANFVSGVPSSATFRFYHMEHHLKQGYDECDTDIPTQFEVNFFTNTFLKLIWVIGQVFAYALRPIITHPKPINKWQILNAIAQILFDGGVVYFLGWSALIYLISGSLIGLGLHPAAGHFIAEHYEFVKGYETYSYYGPINYVNFNVGFHNEHHDFPRIPWSRLGLVRQIAPEWYMHLPHHESYLKVFWNYITDPTIGPWSRIKRLPKNKN